MSFNGALEKANTIFEYYKLFRNGDLDDLFQCSDFSNSYFHTNSDGKTWIVYSTSGSRETIEYCCNPDRDYISYCHNSEYIDLELWTPDDSTYMKTTADGDELNAMYQDWLSEEYYFQQSTLHKEMYLDAMVVLSYLRSKNLSPFYLNLGYLEEIKKSMQG